MITHATANLWEAGEYREIQDKTKICDKKMQVLRLLPPSALILKEKAFKSSSPSTKKRSFGKIVLTTILTLIYLNSDRVH